MAETDAPKEDKVDQEKPEAAPAPAATQASEAPPAAEPAMETEAAAAPTAEEAAEAPAIPSWKKAAQSGFSFAAKTLLKSPLDADVGTRKMGIVFWLALLGIVFVIFYAFTGGFSKPVEEINTTSHESEDASMEEESGQLYTVNVGRFFIPYRRDADASTKRSSVPPPLASVDLVLTCDTEDACKYIDRHMEVARDQILSGIEILTREELLSFEGKQKLKTRIKERLNQWLPHGKVKDIFFSRLLVG